MSQIINSNSFILVVIFVLLHLYSSLIFFNLFLLDSFENRPVLAALVSFNLLSLFRLVDHHLNAGIVLVLDLLEHPVHLQVLHVPFV